MTHPLLEEVSFVVLSTPVAQPRQRHAAKVLGGGQVRSFNYVPKEHRVHAYKYALQQEAKKALGDRDKFHGPVHFGCTFVLPRPNSLNRKKDPAGRIPCTARKGDLDNLIKPCQDCLNTILWDDDSQICSLFAAKFYAAKGEPAHAVFLVQEFHDGKSEITTPVGS